MLVVKTSTEADGLGMMAVPVQHFSWEEWGVSREQHPWPGTSWLRSPWWKQTCDIHLLGTQRTGLETSNHLLAYDSGPSIYCLSNGDRKASQAHFM